MARRIMLNGTSYFGQGAIQEIVNEIKNRHFKKVLVTSTPDLFEFKVATKVTDLLDAAGIAYDVYDNIKPNPTIENVTSGVAACKAAGAEAIVAVGGGSAIDTSKAIATIITNPEFSDVRSLEGLAPTKHPCLPIIAVSTTSGTAAEVTINYVITDVEKNRKFVCVDPHDIPIVAIVDPDMSASMPTGLCASTGMDALVHAVEGYITKGAWELTDMLHLKAIEIIGRSLRSAVAGDFTGREAMSLGQYIAGMGFSNVGLGIVHSMAHKTGAAFADYGAHLIHGAANAMYLPKVIAFNAKDETAAKRYAVIADEMKLGGETTEEKVKLLIDYLRGMNDKLNIPHCIKNYGKDSYPTEQGFVPEDVFLERLHDIAVNAIADACTGSNPRQPSVEEMEKLLKCCYYDTEVDF